jgi:acyl-CoA synthetase (AMP-forming)/AMP-acid ligase II
VALAVDTVAVMPSPRTLCDLFDSTVAERGPQVALRSDDGSFVLTWSEYAAEANAAAAGLAGLGVGHGDTVACWLVDRPELDLAHAGALRLGAVPFSLHPTLTLAQAAQAIADAAARVLITEPAFLGAALVVRGAGRTPLRIIVLVEGADAYALTWAELLDCAPAGLDPDLAARAVQPDDAATLIHGADGNAVAITHRQILGLIARSDECDPMTRSQSLLGPYGRWQVPDQV